MSCRPVKLYVVTMIIVLLAGCSYFVSWDEAVRGVVGRPIGSFIKSYGPPNAIIPLPSGSNEYKYHMKKIDSSCVHYWVVNPKGVITGYRYTGRCRPIG